MANNKKETLFTKEFIESKNKIWMIFSFWKTLILKNKWRFLFSLILAVTGAIASFNINLNIGKILQKYLSEQGNKFIWNIKFDFKINIFGWIIEHTALSIGQWVIRVAILVFAIKAPVILLHYYLLNYSTDYIEKELKIDLFSHFINSHFFPASIVAGDLITQISKETEEAAHFAWNIPNQVLKAIISIVMYVFWGMEEGAKGIKTPNVFKYILLTIFICIIFISIYFFRKSTKFNLIRTKKIQEENKIIYERINNLINIKIASGEEFDTSKVRKNLDQGFKKGKEAIIFKVLFKAVPDWVLSTNIPTLFLIGFCLFVKENEEEIFRFKNFYNFFSLVKNLSGEVNKLIEYVKELDELIEALGIIQQTLKDIVPEFPEKKYLLPYNDGDINFKDIHFTYPNRPKDIILKDFNFTFKKGKSYGITGKNGAGKSTAFKLLLKLFKPDFGSIKVAGIDVKDISSKDLRKKCCYQTNRPLIFGMTIAENIYYPDPVSKDYLTELPIIAEKVGLLNFIINDLPNGFDTQLSEQGSNLSEGQKQELAAMRIFIRDYDFYVCDEILSNVNPNLKEKILFNIFEHIKGKTVIVVDHQWTIFRYIEKVLLFSSNGLIEKKKEDYK